MDIKEIAEWRESTARKIAVEEYKVNTQEAMERLKFQFDFSQAGLRNLQFVNGGAMVALLTFIGNGSDRIDENSVFWSFVWFSFGLAVSLASYFAAYLSQSHYMNLAFHRAWDAQHRAEGSVTRFPADNYERNGDRAIFASMGLASASLLAFVIGAFVALEGLK
jgi:hypothetical protein